jgi:hypothetical protein
MPLSTIFQSISWQSVLLVEETGVPWENHRPIASHWQTFPHNVVSSTPCQEWSEITAELAISNLDKSHKWCNG